MNVYLCGGINGLSDGAAKDWREYAKAKLRADTLDPMRRDYRGQEDDHVADIIAGDLQDIDQSHVILANCRQPSWGTAMEIFYASTAGKTVFAVVPPGGRVSPWLRGHSTRCFESLDAAIEAINAMTPSAAPVLEA